MAKPKIDKVRERRIELEIIADAHDEEERAMGWYYYLEERLHFPFTATCIVKRSISPLQVKSEVSVIGIPSEDECAYEMFVLIRWDRKDGLGVPLSQLKPIEEDSDASTRQAVDDWHYWVRMGYSF